MDSSSKNPGRFDVGLALDRVPIGIAATGAAGKIEYANPYLCRLLGLTAEELGGVDIAQFRAAATARIRVELRSTLLAGDTWQGEVALQTRQGEPRHMLESCYPVQDEAGRVSRVIHFFHDLSALRRAEKLSRLAFYDGVTGLPNRSLFDERLIAAVLAAARTRKGLAVLYSDVEHFNCINTVLDHDAGDDLLRLIGTRMRHILRASDTIARVGGDEFAVILAEVDTAEAAFHTSEKLRRACSGWYESAGQQYAVTVSVGSSLYPRDGESAQALLRSAETAMYRVKAANREAYAAQAHCVGAQYRVGR